MKCQYHAVMSTVIRRDSTGLCSEEELAAQHSAIIPPPRCTACAIVSRKVNELLGLVLMKKPALLSWPQAIHWPTRKQNPKSTVKPSQGNSFSSSIAIPGMERTGAKTACRIDWRRANSMVTLLARRIRVL